MATVRAYRIVRSPRLVSPKELGGEIKRARRKAGLSIEEAAQRVGIDVVTMERAESSGWGRMVRTRKHILSRLAGCTLEGPFYRVCKAGATS